MKPPEPADLHRLRAVEGWLMLGLPDAADEEWRGLSPDARTRPEALELRWELCAARADWPAGLAAADELAARHPDLPAGWLHQAYALRRVAGGGLERAWAVLHEAAEKFPDVDVIAYNLACYAAQLGREDDAWEWYLRALQLTGDHGRLHGLALRDADLAPVWPRIRELRAREPTRATA
jgi:tetratricopeptide (TPR) repeat protein